MILTNCKSIVRRQLVVEKPFVFMPQGPHRAFISSDVCYCLPHSTTVSLSRNIPVNFNFPWAYTYWRQQICGSTFQITSNSRATVNVVVVPVMPKQLFETLLV